jgi:hypothetical protein
MSRDAIRAVAIRRNRIVWVAEAVLENNADLDAAVTSLLAAAPLPRFPRPILSVAVGPHASQVRLIAGLPETQDTVIASAIIRENAASFFLKDGVTLLTTGAQPTEKTKALAAAIDEPCVNAVRRVCRTRGWQFGFIAPSAVGLARAFEDRSFVWMDGNFVVEVTHTDGNLESVRTRPLCAAESTQAPHPHLTPTLATLGENALRFADAYGVAITTTVPTLALNAQAAGLWTREHVRRRLAAPVMLLSIGIAALLLSPLGAVWAGHRAGVRLALVRADQLQTVVSTLGVLDRTTAMLEDVRGFANTRLSATHLLGRLARALPPGTVLMSLDLTETHCQIIALTLNPPEVLGAVGRLPGAHSVELVGPVQRETAAGHELQRVTVRWQQDLQ